MSVMYTQCVLQTLGDNSGKYTTQNLLDSIAKIMYR